MVLINANFDNTRVDQFIIRGRQPYMFWVFNISTNITHYTSFRQCIASRVFWISLVQIIATSLNI
jgi:hypothetical protein